MEHDKWPTWNPAGISHLHAIIAVTNDFHPATPPAPTVGLHRIIKLVDYSTLNRLLVITAYVIRARDNFRSSQNKKTGHITADELHEAKMLWIKDCQMVTYWEEVSYLKWKQTVTLD